MSDLDKFLEERGQVLIPSGNVARTKLLAKELALGFDRNLWRHTFQADRGRHILAPSDLYLYRYFEERWKATDVRFYLELLQSHEYIVANAGLYEITPAAFDLIDEAEPYNIFISYKHRESSAFALLVVARLKEHGLMPFCDMALEAGGNWHAELEGRIRDCDYFIVLLGKETLDSKPTVKEIAWAIKYRKTIIPVWHSGFALDSDKWNEVDSKVKDEIRDRQAIRVIEESASDYNRAIVELLNRFGITP